MKCDCCEKCRNPTEKQMNLNSDMIQVNAIEIPEVLYTAICIFNGRYGNGEERKRNLKSLGYTDKDIMMIQNCVDVISVFYDN